MANSIPFTSTFVAQTSYSLGAVCQTRMNLLDRLAGVIMKLGVAKLELKSSIEEGDCYSCESARSEVEKLRSDCNAVRSELEHHRALHGC